jgi:phenylacetic acid degradation operon negative regulatory protein
MVTTVNTLPRFVTMNADARPQSLLLTLFGIHLLDRDVALSAGSVIGVLASVGVSSDAVRSTLTRMVSRGLLDRQRRGRQMYFTLTPRAAAVLRDGRDRVWRAGAVNRNWDGQWTLVGFSFPDSWRRERHDLRSRLIWGGFGPLQNGLWVSPRQVDVAALAGDLGLSGHVKVFRGTVFGPTEVGEVLTAAFDIDALAERYRAFLDRWEACPFTADPLAGQLLLHTDWLDLVRRDPYLPAGHLPPDWPAIRAEELFRDLAGRYREPASAQAARVFI